MRSDFNEIHPTEPLISSLISIETGVSKGCHPPVNSQLSQCCTLLIAKLEVGLPLEPEILGTTK